MNEDLSQSDLKLLYYLWARGDTYIGSKNSLGRELRSGKRIYERIASLSRDGYLKEVKNKLRVTNKGKEQLIPFIYLRSIITVLVPVVGIANLSLGLFWLIFPSKFTPLSLILSGVVLIISSVALLNFERLAERKFFKLVTTRDT